MLIGHINLVKVQAPQDYQIGFQSYIEAMAAIALGKAPALEVVERLDQAVQLRQAALRLLNGKPPITFNAESKFLDRGSF